MPAETHRFFTVPAAIYEQVRTAADAAAGYPSAQAVTSVAPLADAPRTESGDVLVALRAAAIPDAVDFQIANLVAAGAVQELTRSAYLAAMPNESAE